MIDQYNIVWSEQSKNSSESMPCGGRDIGLNVWVENGELLFYAQRSGCFDENNEYMKLGRFRIRFDPNPFVLGGEFRQELRLREGFVRILGQSESARAEVNIWVEVDRSVVHVEIEADVLLSVEAAYEGWRNELEELPDGQSDGKRNRFGCFSWDAYPGKVVRYPDSVSFDGDRVAFHHRNQDDHLLFDFIVKQQDLEEVRTEMVDTQKGRTYGGLLTGDGFVPSGNINGTYLDTAFTSWILKSETAARRHELRLFTHVDQTQTLEEWRANLEASVEATTPSTSAARARARDWWQQYWQRSWLIINTEKNTTDLPWTLGRNYQLFRYQLGCNAFGSYPTKFNGGNFTFDPGLVQEDKTLAPDWRAWGGGSFTAQNQRLVYWPMLKSGDFEQMEPQFQFYSRVLPNAAARVKHYWGHDGCLFTEQMENFGLPIACAWGWEEPEAKKRQRPADFEPGVQVNSMCKYLYGAQLEFAYMIIEHHRFSGIDLSRHLPFIKSAVDFFDAHYQMRRRQRSGEPLDASGKLEIYPSTSCESYNGAQNPSDLIAGLQACLESLLQLDDFLVSGEEKSYYAAYLQRLPDFGYDEVDGDPIMKPAWSWEKYQNVECPQFYPLFPFDRFDLRDTDAIDLFKNTWKHGTFAKGIVQSWHQDGIFFARMGLTREAAEFNTAKMRDSDRRFPTFWGPGHDWVPDHNWGGSGMIGLQEMLMQTIGREIRLFPAWPKQWDVDFKLHAPYKTTVEGSLRSGELVELDVTPVTRHSDLVVMELQEI